MKKPFVICWLFFMNTSLQVFSRQAEIPYTDINLPCSFSTDTNQIIISDKNEFHRVTGCLSGGIDFSACTVIAVKGFAGGCDLPEVHFRIIKDSYKKEYLIEATVYQFGVCRRNNPYGRAICVDKLAEEYTIKFITRQVNINAIEKMYSGQVL